MAERNRSEGYGKITQAWLYCQQIQIYFVRRIIQWLN